MGETDGDGRHGGLLTASNIVCSPATAAAAARVVERAISVALGPVVHTVGLVAAAELGQGAREVAGGRREGEQRNENHTRDTRPFQATVAGRQRVRLHESGHSVHAG